MHSKDLCITEHTQFLIMMTFKVVRSSLPLAAGPEEQNSVSDSEIRGKISKAIECMEISHH